jgi:hypothetical protein
MQATGGLKLTLEPPARDDRRARFAQVALGGGSDGDTVLVTDSRGRLRYRLPEGQYRVRVLGGVEKQFLVEERRWTTVRLALR